MPVGQKMLNAGINVKFIITRYFNNTMFGHPPDLAQQKALMLYMLQHVRQDDEVKPIIAKRQLVAVKYLYRCYVFNTARLNMFNTACRYLYRLVLGRKVMI